MRLAQIIRLWCKVNDVPYASLAKEWGASKATVTRFLAENQTPNGETVARIIAWLFAEQIVPTGEEMCPNCLTPWKCNGPHIP